MKDWQEEFDNKFPYKIAGVIDDFGDNTKSELKDFIDSLLSQQRKEVLEEIYLKINNEINRIKIGFDSRVAKKYLKPESAGFNSAVLKLNYKINIAKENIRKLIESLINKK